MANSKGKDYSHWNPLIVEPEDDFVIFKATEGTEYIDPSFKEKITSTLVSDKIKGAYHYFRNGWSPERQAGHFNAVINPYKNKLSFLACDYESRGNEVKKRDESDRLLKFLETIESLSGMDIYIYTNPSFWEERIGNIRNFKKYKLWIANWGVNKPDIPEPWGTWHLWQYGVLPVNGISLDHNYFNGDIKEFYNIGTPEQPKYKWVIKYQDSDTRLLKRVAVL